MASSHGTRDHSRFAASDDCLTQNWHAVDSSLRPHLSPLLSALSTGQIRVAAAGDEFSTILSSTIPTIDPRRPKGPHRPRSIEKLTTTLTIAKNETRRFFKSNPPMFLSAVRAHNKALVAARKSSHFHSGIKQEAAFRQNPWKFSKSVCCSNSRQEPAFSESTCFNHFNKLFNINTGFAYNGLQTWLTNQYPHLTEAPQLGEPAFDTSPITPSVIRKTLSKC